MEFNEKRTTHGGLNYRGKLTYTELKKIATDRSRLAFTDERTGLLNPRGLAEEFLRSKAIFNRENNFDNYTIIALDMIGLHGLNAEFGRTRADQILESAANSLVTSTRETDLRCRYDGDEFMVVAFNCNENEAERIIDLINSDLPEHVKYTIGFKEFDPNSDFRSNISKMKEAVEKIKETRPRDETGRVLGEGVVVKID